MFREDIQTMRLKALINSNFINQEAFDLVKAGANPNVKNQEGDSLLHLLVKYNAFYRDSHNNLYIRALVNHYNADINQKNAAGMTPLQCLLCDIGFLTKDAMFLVRLGADPNSKNLEGDSLLHLLTKFNDFYRDDHNNIAIDELVQKHKADINIVNLRGKTPLECMLDNIGFLTENAMLLVKLGANPNSKNSQGLSLLALLNQYNLYKRDYHNTEAIYKLKAIYAAGLIADEKMEHASDEIHYPKLSIS